MKLNPDEKVHIDITNYLAVHIIRQLHENTMHRNGNVTALPILPIKDCNIQGLVNVTILMYKDGIAYIAYSCIKHISSSKFSMEYPYLISCWDVFACMIDTFM